MVAREKGTWMMQSRRLLWAFVAALATTPSAVLAQGASDDGLLTFVIENDVFGEKEADRDYTNGFKLTWMSVPQTTPAWAKSLARLGDGLAVDDSKVQDVRVEFEFGQSMFTPQDLSRAAPDPRDRPYAGFLYGAVGLVGKRDDSSLEQLQLVLGVVGPSSRAKEVQRGFHELIGVQDPKGWDTQIANRLAGELRAQRTEITRNLFTNGAYRAEITPHYGLSLGNLTTSANVGFGFRAGKSLPQDFGPPRIYPSLPGSGYFVPVAGFGWYLFGGIDVRYVAHNMVLDEPSQLGARVTRQPWVIDGQYGIAAYWHGFRAAFTMVTRTREFKQQSSKTSSFGALSLTWRY